MPLGVGGGQNVFVPSTNWQIDSLALQVEFSRAPRSFPINRYTKLVKVEAIAGKYVRIGVNEAIRMNSAKYNWPPASDRPVGKNLTFEFADYSCERYAFAFQVPTLTSQQAAFPLVAASQRQKAQLAMTNRTYQLVTEAVTSGNYPTANYAATAGAVSGGGSWYSSTEDNSFIQGTIRTVMQTIGKQTGGAVKPEDMQLVLNPVTAGKAAKSPEMRQYVKNWAASREYQTGSSNYSKWGLPDYLFGVEVVVEDTVYNTSIEGNATQTLAYVLADDKVFFASRPGGLEGVEGSASFSTWQINVQEDMTVEQELDTKNRRIDGAVIDTFDAVGAALMSGFLIASVAS